MFSRSLDVRDCYAVTGEFFYGTFEVTPVGCIPHPYGCKGDVEPHPFR